MTMLQIRTHTRHIERRFFPVSLVIIELEDNYAYSVLWLVEKQVIKRRNTIWGMYWADVVAQIKKCMDAQAGAGEQFFQCSACTDEERIGEIDYNCPEESPEPDTW
jgi:hypothetical protein